MPMGSLAVALPESEASFPLRMLTKPAPEQITEYQKAMDWGIDLIQTDHPLRVMRAIELRSAGR